MLNNPKSTARIEAPLADQTPSTERTEVEMDSGWWMNHEQKHRVERGTEMSLHRYIKGLHTLP